MRTTCGLTMGNGLGWLERGMPEGALPCLVALALGLGLPPSVTAQDSVPPPAAAEDWSVLPSAAADLWFHGLAVIGVRGEGPLAFYSAEYAATIRAEKAALGIAPTALDSSAEHLRTVIAGDRALSLLHFMPLYFQRVEPQAILRALGAVAARRMKDSALAAPGVRLASLVAEATFQKKEERQALAAFVSALEEEWELFYRDYWQRLEPTREAQVAELRELLGVQLVPRLHDFLERRALTRGTVIPSPALGPEGRLEQGVPVLPLPSDSGPPGARRGTPPGERRGSPPGAPSGEPPGGRQRGGTPPQAVERRRNLVAVWLPPDSNGGHAAAYAVLKELCFALVDRALPPDTATQTGTEAARVNAAVRCGATILEYYAPEFVSGYRATFLRALDHGTEHRPTTAAFETAFPLDERVWVRLRDEIRRP